MLLTPWINSKKILPTVHSYGNVAVMNAIADAIRKAGGPTKLGKALGITRQAVEQWRERVVPPEHVLAIEKLTGITRYELRPDIYGSPPANPKRRAA